MAGARSTRLKLRSSLSASKTLNKPPLLLESLPAEVRERIYDFYFDYVHYVVELTTVLNPLVPLPHIRVLQCDNQVTPHRVLQSENQAPLLRTCRYFRKDAWPSYVRHILFVIASNGHIPPLRRIKYPDFKDHSQSVYLLCRAIAERAEMIKRVKEAGLDGILDQDDRKEDDRPTEKVSAFDWERQESYYQNWDRPVLSLSEIIPKHFLRHIRSITGLYLEDLSDQHLLQDPDIYHWLVHDELPCLRIIGFEQRTIKWEQQDISNDDYDHVMAKLLTPKSDAYKADELCWDRARVHWNTHPTIHFVTKFYAQHSLENEQEFLTPVSVDHREKSVTWAPDLTVKFPQSENGDFWVGNLWLHSHRVQVMQTII